MQNDELEGQYELMQGDLEQMQMLRDSDLVRQQQEIEDKDKAIYALHQQLKDKEEALRQYILKENSLKLIEKFNEAYSRSNSLRQ